MERARQLDSGPIVRGVWAAFRVTLRRLAGSSYMAANLILAGIPIGIMVLIILLNPEQARSIQKIHGIYENFLRTLYLHFVVFFVANVFGFAIIRQEIEEQTLHYLFLQPIRRWVLLLGKFLAFLLLSSLICVISLWLAYIVAGLVRFGPSTVVADLFGNGRWRVLSLESLVILLGVAAYGSIGLLMGTWLKSGLYWIFLLGWEGALPYLPSSLKFWTISHYLHSLLPQRLTEQKKLFELLGQPASFNLSIIVLLGVCAVFVALAMLVFHQKECMYAET